MEVGRKLLDRELRKVGSSWRSASASDEFQTVLQSSGHSKEEDLLAAVGFGKTPVSTITGPFREEVASEADTPEDVRTRTAAPPAGGHALEVTGDADFLVYLAKCCKPLPGEEIVGFVTRGKGVAVHGRECPNVRNLMYHPEREIEVRWAPSRGSAGAPTSQVDVDMAFDDSSGMLASISQVISSEGSDILNCQLRSEPSERGFAAMTILVHDASQLARILTRLKTLKGMVRVERRGS